MERFMAPGKDSRDETTRLLDSVAGYLSRLLNTHEGSTLISQDFGMPDMSSLSQSLGGGSIADIEQAIASAITRYEPRLSAVSVRHVDNSATPLNLSFSLTASLNSGERTVPVIFETVVRPDGYIEIKGLNA